MWKISKIFSDVAPYPHKEASSEGAAAMQKSLGGGDRGRFPQGRPVDI